MARPGNFLVSKSFPRSSSNAIRFADFDLIDGFINKIIRSKFVTKDSVNSAPFSDRALRNSSNCGCSSAKCIINSAKNLGKSIILIENVFEKKTYLNLCRLGQNGSPTRCRFWKPVRDAPIAPVHPFLSILNH
jgi:hypothetical protein